MNEENSLLTGAVRPALLRYALPIILSMVATQFYAVADTMIIGLRLDADALAAVSNASTVLMIFLFISGGMELGGGLLVAAGKPTATPDCHPGCPRRRSVSGRPGGLPEPLRNSSPGFC